MLNKLLKGSLALLLGGYFVFNVVPPVNSARAHGCKPTIENLVEHVYCLKTEAVYMNVDQENETFTMDSLSANGTAFNYRFDKGWSYLITNDHVVHMPEHIPCVDSEGSFQICSKVSETTYIVDSANDEDDSDDVELEEVVSDADEDYAILRVEDKLRGKPSGFVVGGNKELNYGDDVFLIGYPAGLFPAYREGAVANPEPYGNDGWDVLDLEVTGGQSGSPYFTQRGGRYVWEGMIMAKMQDPYDGSSFGLGIGIDIESFKDELFKPVEEYETKKDETECQESFDPDENYSRNDDDITQKLKDD